MVMDSLNTMSRPYDIITFDCYGTLIDWRGGIAAAFAEAAQRAGRVCDISQILAMHAELEPEFQLRPYRRYREVLDLVERRICGRLGWELPEPFLAESVSGWVPFPDTNGALERLKTAGYRLGILSNIDNDLLAATRRHLTVEFDLLVTAEDVQSYKPAVAHFKSARQLIGGNRWLHAAQSYFHDIEPSYEIGVSTVWVNRLSEHASGVATPDANVRDLGGLVDWLSSAPRKASADTGRKGYMSRDE